MDINKKYDMVNLDKTKLENLKTYLRNEEDCKY